MSTTRITAEILVGQVWTELQNADLSPALMSCHISKLGLDQVRGCRSDVGICDLVFRNDAGQAPVTITGPATTTLYVNRRLRVRMSGPSAGNIAQALYTVPQLHGQILAAGPFNQAVTVGVTIGDVFTLTWTARAQFDSIYNQDGPIIIIGSGGGTNGQIVSYTNKWVTYTQSVTATGSATGVTIGFRPVMGFQGFNSTAMEYKNVSLTKNGGANLLVNGNFASGTTSGWSVGAATVNVIRDYLIKFNGKIANADVAPHKSGTLATVVKAVDFTNDTILKKLNPPLAIQKNQAADQLLTTVLNTLYDGSYAATILIDSPARLYPLNEASGAAAADVSVSALAGTYNGTVTYGTVGALVGDPSTAITFPGTAGNYVSLPALALAGSSFSVSMWVNQSASPAAAMALWGAGSVISAQQSAYLQLQTNGAVTFGIYNINKTTSAGVTVPGTWVHICAVYDAQAQTASIYINGVLSGAAQTNVLALTPATSTMTLAADFGTFDLYAGSMQAVAIFTVALAASDVLRHYNAAQGTNNVVRIPGRQLAPGLTIYQRAFDKYTDQTAVRDAVTDTALSDTGTQWIDADGTIRYGARDFMPKQVIKTPALVVQDGQAMTILQQTSANDTLRNNIVVTYHPRDLHLTNTVLGSITSPIILPPQVNKGTASKTVVTITFKDATGNTIGGESVVTPIVATTDYKVSDNPAGPPAGFDYTASTQTIWVDTFVVGASQLTMTFNNRATGPLYVWFLQCRGTAVLTYSPAKAIARDSASIAANGERDWLKDLPFADDQNYITSMAQYMLQRYTSPFFEVRSIGADFQTTIGGVDLLTLELMSVVSISDIQSGLSNVLHIIIGIDIDTHPEAGNSLKNITYMVQRLDSNTYWVLGDATYGVLGVTTRLYI